MTRRTAHKREHFWLEVLFAMLDIGSGDSVLVNALAAIADVVLALAVISALVLASHLMHP